MMSSLQRLVKTVLPIVVTLWTVEGVPPCPSPPSLASSHLKLQLAEGSLLAGRPNSEHRLVLELVTKKFHRTI